jgi:hypothetical protein
VTNAAKAITALVVAIACCAGYVVWRNVERAFGARDALIAQLHAAHEIDSTISVAFAKAQLQSAAAADTARAHLRQHARADAVVQARSDSAVQTLAVVQARADSTVADKDATNDDLRAGLQTLSAQTAVTVKDLNTTVASLQTRLSEAFAVIAADSTAIQKGIAATNAATKRAVDAEQTTNLLRSQLPSTAGKVTRVIAEVVGGSGLLWLGSRLHQ